VFLCWKVDISKNYWQKTLWNYSNLIFEYFDIKGILTNFEITIYYVRIFSLASFLVQCQVMVWCVIHQSGYLALSS